MAAHCKNCSKRIPWSRSNGSYHCHECGTALTLQSDVSIVMFVVFWSIAEIPLRLLVANVGPGDVLWWCRTTASLAIGIGIWLLLRTTSKKVM